jgi:hypothetical protein
LPGWVNAVAAALFVVRDPGPTDAPLGDAPLPVGGVLAAVSSLLDAGGTWGRGGKGTSPDDGASAGGGGSSAGAEGALLAGACGVLWLVLQRRRAVRARREEGAPAGG